MLARLARRLPASWLRFLGRAQYRIPLVRPLAQWGARRLAGQVGVIQRGVGAGLRFEPGVAVAGYRLGTTEPEVQAVFAEHVRAGDVVYDVGANVGFFTVIAGRLVGPTGRVYAFEPFGESADRIRRNADHNDFGWVEVEQAAVSEAPGMGALAATESPVTFRLDDVPGPRAPTGTLPVRLISLDAFATRAAVRPPTFVKIDVEGNEERVIRGMLDVLARHRPVVLCEVHYRVANFEAFLAATVEPLGYTARTLSGEPMPAVGALYHVVLEPTSPSV
ncbi:MAG: FkbM family methyltransferase [Bacteroidota bacterium]